MLPSTPAGRWVVVLLVSCTEAVLIRSPATFTRPSRVPEFRRDQQQAFHLHFGAGRLGLGLVVPAVAKSGTPFAVVQRPKERWARTFADESSIDLKVNGETVANVPLLRDLESLDGEAPPRGLIFGQTAAELGRAVEQATSFSCSLGPGMLKVLVDEVALPDLLPLKAHAEQPILFACENDAGAVATLQEQLEGRCRVIKCMVDRVCTGRTITPQGISIDAESWAGSIVTLEPGLVNVPFSASVLRVPSSKREAEYLAARKLSLVNGMHTVLAFLTLRDCFLPDGAVREYVLLKYQRMSRAQQRCAEAWCTARVYALLREFGVANVMAWHGVRTPEDAWEELLAHADMVLSERFSRVDDVRIPATALDPASPPTRWWDGGACPATVPFALPLRPLPCHCALCPATAPVASPRPPSPCHPSLQTRTPLGPPLTRRRRD